MAVCVRTDHQQVLDARLLHQSRGISSASCPEACTPIATSPEPLSSDLCIY